MQAPGEALVIRMWETFEKSGAAFLQPWQIRRVGHAEADVQRRQQLLIAQTESEIESFKKGDKPLPSTNIKKRGDGIDSAEIVREFEPTLDDALLLSERNRLANDVRGEINVAKTLLIAEEQLLASEDPIPESSPNPDWIHTWREYASKVSEDQLQQIWAAALAGEVTSPGKYTLRTLDFLRHMSRDEADMICRMGPFVTSGYLWKAQKKVWEAEGLSFADLLHLQSIGIIAGADSVSLSVNLASLKEEEYIHIIVDNNKAIIISKENRDSTLTLDAIPLTKIGNEVFSLGKFTANENYVHKCAQSFAKMDYKVRVADFLGVKNGNYYEWDNEVVVEKPPED